MSLAPSAGGLLALAYDLGRETILQVSTSSKKMLVHCKHNFYEVSEKS
jgi:hypothetical protein